MSRKQKIITFLKRFWVFIIFGILVIYAAFVLIAQQSQIADAKKKNEELSSQITQLEEKYTDLESELQNAGSDENAENDARDKLGWVKDNEIVYKPNDSTAENEK